jgi:hypothetical protein
MSDFTTDINGIAEQLNASLGTGDSGSSTPSSPSPTTDTPVSQATPASEAQTTESTSPVDDVIEVTFNDGTKEAIKRSELPNFVMRQKDYTRKTQEAAALRKKYETLEQNLPQIQEEIAYAQQMRQVTQSPEALLGYLVQQLGPEKALQSFAGLMQQNPGAYDPNDIPTYKEAEQLISKQMEEAYNRIQNLEQTFEQRLQERLQQSQQEVDYKRQEQEYATKFDSIIRKSFEEHPELEAVDLVEDVMRFKVSQKINNFIKINGAEPKFEQAAQWWNDAVKEQVNKLNEKFAAKRAASPLNNSIEPSGGNRPINVNTQAKSYYDPRSGQFDHESSLNDLAKRIQEISRL